MFSLDEDFFLLHECCKRVVVEINYIRIFCVWYLHIYLSFAASYQSSQGNQGESDPNNTTVGSSTRCKFLCVIYVLLTLAVSSADICWWSGPKCL